MRSRILLIGIAATCLLGASAGRLAASERLCDTAFEDCRAPLLAKIQAENVRIDVAFWFVEDQTLTDAIIARFKAGVPVRALVDPRRNGETPVNAVMLQQMAAAGIPMRYKAANGILHWKFMLFAGQNTVEFSAANFSDYYFVPVTPYVNYTDEAVYFSDDPAVVDSFETKYDDSWTDTVGFLNYANITNTPTRLYPTYPIDPAMNFVPAQNFATRSIPYYDNETKQIDVTMYKITDARYADALIRAAKRGVPVRLITEPNRYRSTSNVWHAYNVDRMYIAGVKIRHRGHQGFLHQKSSVLYAQGVTIFGSSNWTSDSSNYQFEHNYFTTKTWFFQWFENQFVRKWYNSKGPETTTFVPLPPDAPKLSAPTNGSALTTTSVTLTWNGGPWAHRADVYFGTSSTPALYLANQTLSPNTTKKITISGLAPGTRYYWRIVDKTMANKTAGSATWSFMTP